MATSDGKLRFTPNISSGEPLPSGRLAELRTGDTVLLGSSGLRSAIDKRARFEAVELDYLGFAGDQQTESFHGGCERAVLQYDPDHYPRWREELPEVADRFVPGAFGENFVVEGMSEQNMCIGDVIQAGTALLQVTESRAPCFKLNHRFNHPDMARLSQETRRTGWLYRVLKPGHVRVGDEIAVVGRPLPEWTVARVQHYLYGEVDDLAVAADLAVLPFLSINFRGIFSRRVENAEVEDWEGRLTNGSIETDDTPWFEVEVTEIVEQSRSVRAFRFARSDGEPLPSYAPGAHIDIKVDNAITRSYSLCATSDDRTYRIAVGRAANSRGGSAFLHTSVKVGDRLTTTAPRNFFPMVEGAKRYIMVAGGIGITPFLPMVEACERDGIEWELHYSVREAADAAFAAELGLRFPDRFHLYAGEGGGRLDMRALLREYLDGAHVYCCGSAGYRSALRDAGAHWPEGTVHFEAFEAVSGEHAPAFSARIDGTGTEIIVPSDVTLLAALREGGVDVPSLCEAGTCGTCRIGLLRGDVQHNDMVLSKRERRTAIISCVSRARGEIVLSV